MENISLTQRIVGAIVILSLAIIFIPALLETDRLDPGKTGNSPIPEVPREISTIIFQLNESNGKFEGEGLTASEQLTQEVTREIATSANEIEITPSASQSSNNSQEHSKSLAAEVVASPQSVIDDGKQHSWMLQLASFKDEQNALKLRDKLREKQYVAHVDERKFSSGSVWRVRIGPVLSKEKILKIQALLEKEMGMNGLIVRRR
ncbi:MAG: SPOR domain-containing protein [Gammaproteobacteria bacterium]|nr:SPOR domain-containing protein [Gammaproteobacteria bacterium]